MTLGMKAAAMQCRGASVAVAALCADAERDMLLAMAQRIDSNVGLILDANKLEMAQSEHRGIASAMLDRLRLDADRIAGISRGLREVSALADPVGQLTRRDTRPNGVVVERVRVPLGVIAMMARPNVIDDAAALCLKAGNGEILRGFRTSLDRDHGQHLITIQ